MRRWLRKGGEEAVEGALLRRQGRWQAAGASTGSVRTIGGSPCRTEGRIADAGIPRVRKRGQETCELGEIWALTRRDNGPMIATQVERRRGVVSLPIGSWRALCLGCGSCVGRARRVDGYPRTLMVFLAAANEWGVALRVRAVKRMSITVVVAAVLSSFSSLPVVCS